MTFQAIFQSKWFTVAGLIVIALVGTAIARRIGPLAELKQEVARMEQKIDEARRVQAELQQRQVDAQSTGYLERQARIQLNYKKPGEEVVYVYHNPSNPPYLKGGDTLAKPRSNLQQWWDYLVRD